MRLRQQCFKALLRQDIAFFDEPAHSTGALTARLATDASGVQGATSTRLATMVQVGVMGLTALTIAFVFEWRLTLLILGFVPLLMFGGAMHTKMMTSFAHEENEKIVEAGADHLDGTVQFRDVHFNYPTRPDVAVLRGLNISVNPGQTLALVGSSGCGKSTSVSLIERFYDVSEGVLSIDGFNVRDLNIKWLRSVIGIVSQEPVLFDCSIKDNITYGISREEMPDITMVKVEAAAKSANIHNFISTLPKGYGTLVGDKGTLISGGQKQRIAIARALIRNPKILLLDEATSALDSESEKVVQDALDVAMEGRTSLIIAHRLSTIQNADIIAVVQDGKIIEMGTVLASGAIDVDLRSFACDDLPIGNGACNRPEAKSWIKVNGREVVATSVGWNIVVIDHSTGQIEHRAIFDTHGDAQGSVKLEVFVRQIKPKKIVLGVIHDDAAVRIYGNAINELNAIAGPGIKKIFRGSAAFIGYKDANGADPFRIRQNNVLERRKGPAYIKVTIGKLSDSVKQKDAMHFTLQSAGFIDHGPFSAKNLHGKTYITYKKEHLVGKIGLNFMVIDHKTGAVHSKKHFNTFYTHVETVRAWKFLKNLPPHLIVLGVVHLDWTNKKDQNIINTLKTIVRSHIQLTYDGSWAFVGYSPQALPYKVFTLSRLSYYPRDPVATKKFIPVKIHFFTQLFDIDECKEATDICDVTRGGTRGGTCKNTPGYYTCTCILTKQRYAMGYSCHDMRVLIKSTACYRDVRTNRPWCDVKPIQLIIHGNDILQRAVQGFVVFTIDGNTGVFKRLKTFKTASGKVECANLAKYLDGLTQNLIVIGAVKDDAIQHIGSDVVASIKRLTGVEVLFKGIQGAFAFLGYSGPGLPAWVTAKSTEFMKGPTVISSRFWLMPKPPFLPVKIVSVGGSVEKTKPAALRFMRTDFGKQIKDGFNIAVLNKWTGSAELFGNFNTRDKNAADVRKMEHFLNHLPVDRIIMGIVKGDAYNGLKHSQSLKKSLERILRSPIKYRSAGASFAFIGMTYSGKKELPAYIAQASREKGMTQAMLTPIIGLSASKVMKVNLISTGCKTGEMKARCANVRSSITLNGKELSPDRNGMNIVVVSGISGHVLHRRAFDTNRSHSECTDMKNLLNSLPVASVVLGAVKGEAVKYYRTSKHLHLAMKHILGADVKLFSAGGSYAFVGYKGKTKQSWVQQTYSNEIGTSTKLSTSFVLNPEIQIELVATSCDDPGAGPCDSNKNVIKVNGKDYSKNGRGFNIVTVDVQTGAVVDRQNFDTFGQDSKKMELFLRKLPAKRIVLGVIKDDAYTSLHQGAKTAIATLLHKKSIAFNAFRQSYAFIGYTSLEPFTWIQELRTARYKGPVRLKVGIPIPQYGCVHPRIPLNSNVNKTEYDVSQTVEYKCNKGLAPYGKSQTCGTDGKWVGSIPRCLRADEIKRMAKATPTKEIIFTLSAAAKLNLHCLLIILVSLFSLSFLANLEQ
eukprot:gene17699-19467_t